MAVHRYQKCFKNTPLIVTYFYFIIFQMLFAIKKKYANESGALPLPLTNMIQSSNKFVKIRTKCVSGSSAVLQMCQSDLRISYALLSDSYY
jgi:hypothetical protein